MRNVTITLGDKVASWLRIRAAEKDTSMSRLVGQLLESQMLEEERYRAAQRRFFSHEPVELSESGAPYPTRAELHDRTRLR